MVSANRIIFGYRGGDEEIMIEALTPLPDTVRTMVAKQPGKDSLNYWFTPFETDSIVFMVTNQKEMQQDTFTIKTRNLGRDSLLLSPSHRSTINFQDTFRISANIPIRKLDSNKITLLNRDSVTLDYQGRLDTLANSFSIQFEKEAEQIYVISLLPEAFIDFFGNTNDSIFYRLSTGGYADFGNLRLVIDGAPGYPLLMQLTDEKGKTFREIYATGPREFEFLNLPPSKYLVRIIFDENGNRKWDTGSYLEDRQPERVIYYPEPIEVRANWELEQTFTLPE
jgi:hypothetical protein